MTLTLPVTDPRSVHTGTGSTGPFNIPGEFTENNDVYVRHRDGSLAQSTYVEGTDYTISSTYDDDKGTYTGTITLTTALAAASGDLVAEKLAIWTADDLDQLQDTSYGGSFSSKVLWRALNKLTRFTQYNDDRLDRALVRDVFDGDYDAGGNIIADVADGVADTDAVNKAQVTSLTASDVAATAASAAAASSSETNAAGSASAAAASAATSSSNAASTAADVLSTNADVVSTNADAISTAADVVTTGNNVTASQAAQSGAETARDEAINNYGLKYTFDTSTTTTSDPGAGKVRLNHASFASVTEIAIDDQTAHSGNPDVSSYLLTFDDSSSTIKGQLLLTEIGTSGNLAVYNVTGLTDETGFVRLAVVHIASNGSFASSDDLIMGFVPKGDEGQQGPGSGDMSASIYDPAGIAEQLVGLDSSQTLTNKTISTANNTLTGVATLTGSETLTNKTLTSPAVNNPTGITKSDVGLSNVPNTDATARTNHSGEQAIATVTGLQTALDGKVLGEVDGYSNTFIGQPAWSGTYYNSNNTISGVEAGHPNTNNTQSYYGNNNTFNGMNAGYSNTTGYYNTFNGMSAGYSNTTGYFNTFNGMSAGRSNTTGNYNTFNGMYAGRYLSNGSSPNQTTNSSVYIGYNSKASADGVSNEIVIGKDAVGAGSNTVTLGNTSVDTLVVGGNSYDADALGGATAWVNFNGTGTVAIRGSKNVSSITDNGTGDYTVNFTTALANTNYAVVLGGGRTDSNTKTDGFRKTHTHTTSSVGVCTMSTTTAAIDHAIINVAIFGG